VSYYDKDHKSGRRKTETIDAESFIGRMVQHILPKGFQRIRYYGLQATKSFTRWCHVIKEGLKKVGKLIKDVYQIIEFRGFRDRHKEAFGQDPLLGSHCGSEMELSRIWHAKYGLLYDLMGPG
jgi:hypothetical protein